MKQKKEDFVLFARGKRLLKKDVKEDYRDINVSHAVMSFYPLVGLCKNAQ